jgi:hypothetical protein
VSFVSVQGLATYSSSPQSLHAGRIATTAVDVLTDKVQPKTRTKGAKRQRDANLIRGSSSTNVIGSWLLEAVCDGNPRICGKFLEYDISGQRMETDVMKIRRTGSGKTNNLTLGRDTAAEQACSYPDFCFQSISHCDEECHIESEW